MPRSKRDRKVSLTKTKKKGLSLKEKTMTDVRDCCDKYSYVFTFSVLNMRNSHLKDVRQDWKHSRLFFGKNKVISLALGRGASDEVKENLHKVSSCLKGQMGLLFTNKSKKHVLQYFNSYHVPEYARSGNVATQTVTLNEGPLPDFPHSMEPQLRKLGLPTSLKKGIVTLQQDYTVCKVGDVLTPEQCQILKHCGHKMVDFYVTITSMWKEDGTFEQVSEHPEFIKPSQVSAQLRYKDKDEINEDEPIEIDEKIDEV